MIDLAAFIYWLGSGTIASFHEPYNFWLGIQTNIQLWPLIKNASYPLSKVSTESPQIYDFQGHSSALKNNWIFLKRTKTPLLFMTVFINFGHVFSKVQWVLFGNLQVKSWYGYPVVVMKFEFCDHSARLLKKFVMFCFGY